jgi:hypothetical protein
MPKKNDLFLLAEFIEQNYVLPYTHEELLDLLERIATGHILSNSEYELFKNTILGDNIDGEIIFTGDYNDLINKPDIPENMTDLKDYSAIMSRINQLISALDEKDKELAEQVSDNSRFLSALEIVLNKDVKRLEELIKACQLFEGESLEDVIFSIQSELGWLEYLKEDIGEGKGLSDRNFTEIYESVLESIISTAGGLAGYIRNIIAESIVDPGLPNGNGSNRLDSIGEALATKVDYVFGMGLSQHNFSDKYKNILDCVLYSKKNEAGEFIGSLEDYVMIILDRYEEEFGAMIEDLGDRMNEYTENQVQDMKETLFTGLSEMRQDIDQNKQETLDGVSFKEGDGPVTISIGGIEKGSIIEGRTVRDVLLEILCPFVDTTISLEIELSSKSSFLSRIEDVVEVKRLIANIERGSYPIKRISFYVHTGSQYKELITRDTSMSQYYIYNFPDIEEYTSSLEEGHYMVEIEDIEGNTSQAYSQPVEVVCPVFYGVIGNNVGITEELLKAQIELLRYYGTTCSIKYTTNNQRMLFAIPSGYGDLVDILDQNGYIITNSFERYSVQLTFKIKELFQGTLVTNKKTVNYTVFCNNPSTVNTFEITYKF